MPLIIPPAPPSPPARLPPPAVRFESPGGGSGGGAERQAGRGFGGGGPGPGRGWVPAGAGRRHEGGGGAGARALGPARPLIVWEAAPAREPAGGGAPRGGGGGAFLVFFCGPPGGGPPRPSLGGLVGPKNALESGTFTGYSALAVALVLPKNGKLVACDVSEEWTSVGRPHWEQAGVAAKIDLRIAPAVDTLKALEKEGRADSFDFAFIDANKGGYDAYYEHALRLVRAGGVIAFDNMLQGGRVADRKARERRHDGHPDAQRQDRRRHARRQRAHPGRRRHDLRPPPLSAAAIPRAMVPRRGRSPPPRRRLRRGRRS